MGSVCSDGIKTDAKLQMAIPGLLSLRPGCTRHAEGDQYSIVHSAVGPILPKPGTSSNGLASSTTAENISDDSEVCLQSVIMKLCSQPNGLILPNNAIVTATEASRPCVEDKLA
ncbi:hypothetical protein CLF_100965 [Clonorchis sinensis]|uniref:Uncharacterized protein n=1 Tax=Clonorchis sinensis TaxID=79923 RepID=G7Y4N2_CLOSI|nr:hypothetical protein CLF_100965 [Clonorchis sinensis]